MFSNPCLGIVLSYLEESWEERAMRALCPGLPNLHGLRFKLTLTLYSQKQMGSNLYVVFLNDR